MTGRIATTQPLARARKEEEKGTREARTTEVRANLPAKEAEKGKGKHLRAVSRATARRTTTFILAKSLVDSYMPSAIALSRPTVAANSHIGHLLRKKSKSMVSIRATRKARGRKEKARAKDSKEIATTVVKQATRQDSVKSHRKWHSVKKQQRSQCHHMEKEMPTNQIPSLGIVTRVEQKDTKPVNVTKEKDMENPRAAVTVAKVGRGVKEDGTMK